MKLAVVVVVVVVEVVVVVDATVGAAHSVFKPCSVVKGWEARLVWCTPPGHAEQDSDPLTVVSMTCTTVEAIATTFQCILGYSATFHCILGYSATSTVSSSAIGC